MQDIFSTIQELLSFIFFGPSDPNIQYAAIPVALIGLALSAATTGYGMYKKGQASKEAREARAEQNKQFQSVADWYDAEGSKDFLDTDTAQSTLGNIREQYKKGIETNESSAARGGATAEAKVANKSALNEKYNQVLNNMVGYGTQYKTNLKKDYSNALNRVAEGQNTMYGADVASWGNLANNAGEAFVGAAGSTDWGSVFGGQQQGTGNAGQTYSDADIARLNNNPAF